MSDLEKKLLQVVDNVLGPNGKMVRGKCEQGKRTFRYNNKQHEYAKAVARGFCRYSPAERAAAVNMLQAATGTGKTLGYLVPAFAYSAITGERVIVSTYTKALQQQILKNDAPRAQAWVQDELGVSVSFARRVGRANYLSMQACQYQKALLADAGAAEAADFVAGVIAWLQGDAQQLPTLDDYLAELGEGASLPDGLDSKLLCLSSESPEVENEAYTIAMQETHAVDVAIVNHALVMMDAMLWTALLNPGRQASVLICDEADRLTDAAESVLGADVSMHQFSRLTQEVAEAFSLPGITDHVGNLYSAVMAVDPGHAKMATLPQEIGQRIAGVLSTLKPHVEKFSTILTSPQSELGDSAHKKALIANFCDSYNSLDAVLKASRSQGNTSIISWSPVRHYPSLRVGQPEPARILTRLLAKADWWDEDDGRVLPERSYLKAALFTSATLATPGRTLPAAFDAFANTVGVIRHCKAGMNTPIHNVTADLYRVFDAPADFGEMFFVLPAPDAPLPTGEVSEDQDYVSASNPEWLAYTGAMIREAASAGGKTLVLTLSHADTKSLGLILADVPGLIVAKQGDSMSTLKQRYVETENAVMISPGAWEGLDLPGDVQNLVITRLPFGSLNGFRLSLKEAVLRHRGYSEDKITAIKFADLGAEARRRLVQGLGRGIRQRDDRVEVWIADSRFPYPESFSSSLDDALMVRRQRVLATFAGCIPQRFEDSFNAARLFLTSGKVHTPELV
ncbi:MULTISPECIES: ATP-dependent DNA helicase [Pseudomonadaceae]|uniref:ATP-dependent DNA helicase DinG n=2 Tax=Pseudomonadaceae TaxID=135621 RepID=A0A379JZM0_ECTOL|nr:MULTISPECIES: ATP-dependent DNA helicase [Pseudomonas]KEX94885.1 hypothetical protein HA62_04435 [Pseudomonas putida]SDV17082.1 ATP-dependent DNA helicase DinG [Pseudomonas rhodesiae]SUD57886.1 ATP-dependent DNA helicase DinG [Pseudomonas oleovorans]